MQTRLSNLILIFLRIEYIRFELINIAKENKELFSKEYIHSFGIVNGNIRFAIEKENYKKF